MPGNPITREHLWSDWMTRAGLIPNKGEHFEFRNLIDGKSKQLKAKFYRTRQGGAPTKTVKVVCKSCNTGWMSNLESQIQPILTPLISGTPAFLRRDERKLLAEWIMMKMFVAEHDAYPDHPANPIFEQSTRSDFMRQSTVPDGVEIHIVSQLGAGWISGFYRYAGGLGFTTTWPPPPVDAGTPPTMQAVTWGIGKLLIHMNAIIDPVVRQKVVLTGVSPLVRLWPLTQGDLMWPTRFIVGDDSINAIANAMQAFVESDAVTHAGA